MKRLATRASGGRRKRPPNPRTESATNREQTVDKLFRIQAVLFESHSALTKKISPPAPPAWRKKRKKVQKSIQKISTRGAAVRALWDSREILAGRAKDTNREGDGKKKKRKSAGARQARRHTTFTRVMENEDEPRRQDDEEDDQPSRSGGSGSGGEGGGSGGDKEVRARRSLRRRRISPTDQPRSFLFFRACAKKYNKPFPHLSPSPYALTTAADARR